LTETEAVVDALSRIVKAYGEDAREAGRISDELFAAARLAKIPFDELLTAIQNAVPIAAQYGVSLEEVLASLVRMGAAGYSTTESVRDLRAMLTALADPAPEALAALQNVTGGTWNLKDAMAQEGGLIGVLRSLSDEDLPLVFGGFRGLNEVMALIGTDGGKSFLDAMAEIETSMGTTEERFGQMQNRFQSAWSGMRETLENSREEIIAPIEGFSGEVLKIFNDMFGPNIRFAA
jgi:TP901 family phage tail tape measure protein